MKRMRKCAECGEYTLLDEHCGEKTSSAHPPKYNPNDRYAKYRRDEKGISSALERNSPIKKEKGMPDG